MKRKFLIKGISVFVSQPHFLNAEKKLLIDVTGMSPNDLAHDSIIQFEPVNEHFILDKFLDYIQSPLSITNWLGPIDLFVIRRVCNIESFHSI